MTQEQKLQEFDREILSTKQALRFYEQKEKIVQDLDEIQSRVNELSEELENLGVVRSCLSPPKEKAAPEQKAETMSEPESRTIITPQQEKASVIGRLHRAQQIVDETERRKQAERKKGYSMEH